MNLEQGSASFYLKGHRVNIVLVGHKISVTSTQLCRCGAKVLSDNTHTSGRVCVTQTGGKSTGCGLPTSDLEGSEARFKLKSLTSITKLPYNKRK